MKQTLNDKQRYFVMLIEYGAPTFVYGGSRNNKTIPRGELEHRPPGWNWIAFVALLIWLMPESVFMLQTAVWMKYLRKDTSIIKMKISRFLRLIDFEAYHMKSYSRFVLYSKSKVICLKGKGPYLGICPDVFSFTRSEMGNFQSSI